MRHGCEHAIQQAQTRYGVMLDEGDFAAMVADILARLSGCATPATLLARMPFGREIWLLRIPSGPAVRVVYSPVSAQIITVLPKGYALPRGTLSHSKGCAVAARAPPAACGGGAHGDA
jgi:hypothetical protein